MRKFHETSLRSHQRIFAELCKQGRAVSLFRVWNGKETFLHFGRSVHLVSPVDVAHAVRYELRVAADQVHDEADSLFLRKVSARAITFFGRAARRSDDQAIDYIDYVLVHQRSSNYYEKSIWPFWGEHRIRSI